MTSISKNYYAGVIEFLSHFQTKSLFDADQGSGLMKAAIKYTIAHEIITL